MFRRRWSFIFSLCAIALSAHTLTAQQTISAGGYKLQSISVSSGEDALSSGISGTARFVNGLGYAEFTVQTEQAWFNYGAQFSKGPFSGLIAGSIGHFQKAPWVGPLLSLNLSLGSVAGVPVSIGTMQWPAFLMWEAADWKDDGIENTEPILLGYFMSNNLSIGPISLSASFLNFLDDPWNELYGASYTQRINREFQVATSVTRNNNSESWMLWMGATWTP